MTEQEKRDWTRYAIDQLNRAYNAVDFARMNHDKYLCGVSQDELHQAERELMTAKLIASEIEDQIRKG